jgi:hypothetical protein
MFDYNQLHCVPLIVAFWNSEDNKDAENISLERDILPQWCGNKNLYVYKTDGFFYPIKTGG